MLSLFVLPTAPSTSIPYRDRALVDEPNDFPTKSAAVFKSIPLAAAKSRVATVALFICVSSSVYAAIKAFAFIISSSPNVVTFCNAAA